MSFIPARGDLVWVDLSPQSGHEQAGRRPAIVLSPKSYNGKVGLALICPITSRKKGLPFEVGLPNGLPVNGVILADQVKSADWQGRNMSFIAQASDDVLDDVLAKLETLLH